MDFTRNVKASLKALPLKQMTGQQKFLSLAAIHCKGKVNVEMSTKDIQGQWKRSLLKVRYNPSFYDRAQQEGWVAPIPDARSKFSITEPGLDHILALAIPDIESNGGGLKQAGELIIVNRKATHTFDKFLRKVLAEAKNEVLIADSYVDGSIFDGVLDVVPKSVSIKLIYAHKQGNFDQRVKRFSIEYQGFSTRKYKSLHDRFMVIDDTGYILGPSIKDAASNSPALVMGLGLREKSLLKSFFNDVWSKAK